MHTGCKQALKILKKQLRRKERFLRFPEALENILMPSGSSRVLVDFRFGGNSGLVLSVAGRADSMSCPAVGSEGI